MVSEFVLFAEYEGQKTAAAVGMGVGSRVGERVGYAVGEGKTVPPVTAINPPQALLP